jgi:hypothetical protein
MENIHHKPIKRFGLSGQIYDDSDLIRLKLEYTKLILSQMKMSGYVPRLDVDTDFTLGYNNKSEYFEFELSIYGIYLGKKKSQCISGVVGSRALYYPPNKLKESLPESA